MSNSNADEPPAKHTPHLPSLSSLPDEIIQRCLALVPRSYHLSISCVSKHLRALVRSLPELNGFKSTLPKNSLYVCLREVDDEYEEDDDSFFHWFTLNETLTTTEYGLVLNPTPFPPHSYGSSAIAVGSGSKIFFIGGNTQPSTDLWVLDTRSGNITQGPSMSVPREHLDAAVGVLDGKIYVIGGDIPFSNRIYLGEEEEEEEMIQVEVFDPKSETWELAGRENVRKAVRGGASVEGKVYMVEYQETYVYNPRECEGERMVRIVTERLSEDGSKKKFTDIAYSVCVVEGVLFAFFSRNGIMWFDAKLSVWRRLVGRDGKELPSCTLHETAMAEHDGRLVVLWADNEVDDAYSMNVQCVLVSLDRSGDRICGTVDWSGVVATVPYSFHLLHCVAVFD